MTGHHFACAHCRAQHRFNRAFMRGVRRWYHPSDKTLVEVVTMANTPAGLVPVVRDIERADAPALPMRGLMADWMPLEVV
jgi:hypothetical protein